MKTCPSCGAKYSDDLSFCLQDGSRLLAGGPTNDLIAGPTEEYRPGTTNRQDLPEFDTLPSQPTVTPQIAAPQTVKQYKMSAVDPSSKMGCIVTVGQVSLGLLLVSLVGLGGFYFYSTRGNSELAQSEPKFSNTSAPPSFNTNSTANSSSAPPINISSNSANTDHATTANIANVAPSPTATRKPSPTPAATPTPSAPKPTPAPEPSPTTETFRPMPGRSVIAGGNLNGRAISLPRPAYPPIARASNIGGIVAVRVLVDENGNVIAAEAVNGHPLLRPAAVAAARQARFGPVTISGQPVKVRGVLTYNFNSY
jgi:TonB family protein